MTSPTRSRVPDEILRVAVIAPGKLRIPPHGWGAIERGIWNFHVRAAAHGIRATIVNTSDRARITAELREIRPDLIHLHWDPHVFALAAYLDERPTPVVSTSHQSGLSCGIPADAAAAAGRSDACIALSPTIRDRFRKHRFRSVVYVPNGVDTSVFVPLEKEPRSVAAVAAHLPRKRLADVARFFLARPDYRLTICGPRTDDERREPRIPTGDNVRLLGNRPQEDVARLLGESEFFVHLSEREASALVVREAMSAGCRIWTTGYNAGDLENVATSWEAALADPGLGERARREALERLDWSHVVARNVEVQREVVARWRRDGEAARRRQHVWVGRALSGEVRDPRWKSVLRRLVELRTRVVSRAAPSRSPHRGAGGRR